MTRYNPKQNQNSGSGRLIAALVRLVMPPQSPTVPDRLREDMGLPRSENRPNWERFM